jgi:hypothetical protein
VAYISLLGNDSERNNEIATIARQRSAKATGIVLSAWSAKQLLNRISGNLFCVRSVPIRYKQDRCSLVLSSDSGVEWSELVGERVSYRTAVVQFLSAVL